MAATYPTPLRVLIVEDSEDDVELVLRELQRGGFAPTWERVQTAEDLTEALDREDWEIVISDYVMPRLDAVRAFEIVQAFDENLPFIIISGTVPEDVAVELVRKGANDYVMKDKLLRLAPAVKRELRDAEVRRQRRAADAALRQAHRELEMRVQERTAELAEANATLQVEIADKERQRLQLERQMGELSALYEASRALLATSEASRVEERLCELVVKEFGLRMAWIGRLQAWPDDVQRVYLTVSASAGYDEGYTGDFTVDLHDEKRAQLPVMRAIRTGKPVVVDDIANEETMEAAFVKAAAERGYRSLVVLPFGTGEGLMGVLAVYAGIEEAFGEDRVRTLQSLANLTAVALQRAQLHEQVQHHADTLEEQVAARTQALQASEARLRVAIEAAGLGVYEHGEPFGAETYHNARWAEILGYTLDELPPGETFQEWLHERTHPGDVEHMRAAYDDFVAGRAPQFTIEVRLRHKDGEWRHVKSYAHPTKRDENGRVTHMVGVMVDVTADRRSQRALLQAEKLTTTGRLAASFAHEIKNPLQGALGCLGLAREVMAAGEDAETYLETVHDALEKANALTTQLRNLNQQAAMEDRELTQVNALIERVLRLSQTQADDADVTVIPTLADDLPEAMLAAQAIEQVFLNMVLNALDAMPEGGELRVRSKLCPNTGRIRVDFQDTGTGMPPDVAARVFEDFYSTKQEGLGLGLFISRGIVEQHQGEIGFETEEGVGTTFTVWLPPAAKTDERQRPIKARVGD